MESKGNNPVNCNPFVEIILACFNVHIAILPLLRSQKTTACSVPWYAKNPAIAGYGIHSLIANNIHPFFIRANHD